MGRRTLLRVVPASCIAAMLPACGGGGSGGTSGSAPAAATTPAATAKAAGPEIASLGDISRLAAAMAKAKSKASIKICGLGGSITAGADASSVDKRWLNLVAGWLQSTYGCTVSVWNAGIGGTASPYGALRLQRDVLSQSPDIVFVDYAVNDTAADGPSYDSVVRNLLASSPQIAVVPIMFCNNALQSVESTLIPIAQHYGCPVVSYVDGVTAAIKAGTITQAQISSPDGVHPPDFGHALAAQYIEEMLAIAASSQSADANQTAASPLYPNAFDNASLISDDGLQAAALTGFVYAADPGDVPNINVGALMSSNVWDSFEMPINVGSYGAVWIQCAASNDGSKGTFRAQIDGVNYNVTDCNNPSLSANSQELVQIASGLAPGRHVLKITNWPSQSGAQQNDLWICGIGTA